MRHRVVRSTRRASAAMLVAVALLGAAAADDDGAAPGTLRVEITGFESVEGELAIALFATAESFESRANAVRKEYLDIDGESVEWIVERLPPGDYALIAYHDENGNREIDMRLLGMPKEPVAVSNDARGVLGPPGFDAARFEHRAGQTTQRLVLR